jgi:hypothetical protein
VNTLKSRILSVLVLLAVLCTLFLPVLAEDDDAYNGYSADTLTIEVGYFGGPYYEKYVFTLDELWAMDVVYQDYTFIDNMPSVVIDHVAGVRLSDLMEAAGIDLGSVETFYFYTLDKTSDYYTSYSKSELIDTQRYCYYSLPDNFDDEEGTGNEYATLDGTPVDTVIALADDWNRCIAGATFGSDYLNLNTNTRFRLCFGQTNSYERTASRSAKWIHKIVVELGGAPTLDLDASVLDGEVGSVLRTEPSISADSAVAANATISWSSSDTSVAVVDENGNITITGEGTAVITATMDGASASVTVTGKKGAEAVEPSPSVEPSTEPSPSASPEVSTAPSTSPVISPSPSPVASPSPSGTISGTISPTVSPSVSPSTDGEVHEDYDDLTSGDLYSQETLEGHLEEISPAVQSASDTGGVQNWRIYEMSETATELGNIQEDDDHLLLFIGLGTLALFLLALVAYAAAFYLNIGRTNHYGNDQ